MLTKFIATAAAAASIAGAGIGLAATSASAATTSAVLTASHRAAPPRVASGSVQLGNPLQYEKFLALQGFGRNHGDVDYTNWTYAEPGSGVWAPAAGSHALVFTLGGTQYAHTLAGDLKLTAKSPEKLQFSGTGAYNGGGVNWTIRGQVAKGAVKATIVYQTGTPGYTVDMTGTIASDGSASGTAESSTGQALTWAMPAGSFGEELHYHARIQAATIGHHDATFRFTIPASVPGLAGTSVTVKIHDGGRGPAHDTYAHGVTGTTLTPYSIIGGPGITVW